MCRTLFLVLEPSMKSIQSIAALAATLLAASTFATTAAAEQKCGAGTCGKKETTKPADTKGGGKEAACSKKEAACSKKDAGCAKK